MVMYKMIGKMVDFVLTSSTAYDYNRFIENYLPAFKPPCFDEGAEVRSVESLAGKTLSRDTHEQV